MNLWVQVHTIQTEQTVSRNPKCRISTWVHRRAEVLSSGKMVPTLDLDSTMTATTLEETSNLSELVRKGKKELLRPWDLVHIPQKELKLLLRSRLQPLIWDHLQPEVRLSSRETPMLAQANTMTGTMSSDLRLRDSQLARNVRLVLLKQWVQELMTQVELMLSRKLKLQPLSTWDLRQQDQPLLPR